MRIWIGLLTALLTLGCTPEGNGDGTGGAGGGGGSDAGPGPNPTEARVLDALGDYYCGLVRQCRIADDQFNTLRLFADEGGDCEGWITGQLGGVSDGLRSGESQVDSAALDRCLQTALANCVVIDQIAGCRDAVSGRREAGAACPNGEACAPGHYCAYDGPQDDPDACSDTCRLRGAPGSPCEYDDQCADDGDRAGFCRRPDVDAGDGVCATLRLRADAGPGEQCGLVDDAQGPTRVTCGPDLFCTATGDDESGACRALPGPGDACEDDDMPCRDSFCIDGTCTVIQVSNTPGDPCDTRQLQLCNPFSGLICIDAVCTRTNGAQGARCDTSDIGVPCQPGLYCDKDDVCRPRIGDGEPCDPEGDYRMCLSEYCEAMSEGIGGVCVPDPFVDVCR